MSTPPLSHESTHSEPTARWAGTLVSALVALSGVAFLVALVARSQSQDFAAIDDPLARVSVLVASALPLLVGAIVLVAGPQLSRRIGVDGLALIGALSALHFLLAGVSRILGVVLMGVLGPAAIFINGLGDEGVPSFVLAVLVVLRPRVGVAGLSLAGVFLLMALTSGTLGFTPVVFIAASIVAHEVCLALTGLTTTAHVDRPARRAPWSIVVRMALAIGVANALALFVQVAAYRVWYRLHLEPWWVVALVGWTGLVYGGAGAALGTMAGYRWRRIAP